MNERLRKIMHCQSGGQGPDALCNGAGQVKLYNGCCCGAPTE